MAATGGSLIHQPQKPITGAHVGDQSHGLTRPPFGSRSAPMILKALSFGLVGVINTAVDAAVFFLALGYFTSSLIAANIMAWVIAVSNSYVLNSFTTFAAESGRRLLLRAYLMFLTAGLFGLVANTLTLITAALFLPVWAAKALAIGASFLVNFSLSHTVVFRSPSPAAGALHRASSGS